MAVALGLLGSCASLVPEPVVSVAPVLTAAPRTTGVETAATREHRRLVTLFGGESHLPVMERFLNEVLAKLAAASDVPGEAYEVTILDSPIVNAFALPSGNLYVTRGLLALANDTSEVAAVMAHEIAHVTARHALQRAELERKTDTISKAATVFSDRDKGASFQAYARQSVASFSRQQELEADEIGVRVVSRAGYDPYGAARFLESLGRSTALRGAQTGQGTQDKPDMMATHPSTPERVAQAVAVARQLSSPGIGDAGRARFLTALDGLPFGDDPSQGVIRGEVFIHPTLGFGFTAPSGFVLENSSKAILGVARGGAEALRLDSVRVPATTSLDAYLASGWIDGLVQSTVETFTLNGLPAATATAKGTQWTFRLVAVRLGTDVYRLIFATKDLGEDDDKRFRASIDTFKRITPEEAAAVGALHIAVTTAGPGDTVASLGARTAGSDRPIEFFAVLNALESGAALKPGERYKLVTD